MDPRMHQNLPALLTLLAFTWAYLPCFSQANYLKESWKKQSEPLETNILNFEFQESSNQLLHSFSPWQQTNFSTSGEIWIQAHDFSKIDTLRSNQRVYLSKTVLSEQEFLLQNYGKEQLESLTKSQLQDQIFLSARYLPHRLLNYFKEHNIPIERLEEKYAVYSLQINQTTVKLFLDKDTFLLSKIQTLSHDDLFGDVKTTYTYSDYLQIEDFYLAKQIEIKKINVKLLDQVEISHAKFTDSIPQLLERPTDYKLTEEIHIPPSVSTSSFNEHIHLVELGHTDDRALVVEFSDFLLVAEAPLTSENGELIIAEAKKIAPDKPINYFVFGHYHPHYLGGVRPFVQEGAQVIVSEHNQEYLSYIVHATRTVKPDRLSLDSRPLQLELIQDNLRISDGEYSMDIYLIGEKSKHTIDYLVYYFPEEKLLFEDDLIWIPIEGEAKNVSPRQIGLYQAIQDLGLEVQTIIQSWPVSDYGVKTIIPFEELENSIKNLKQ
ncbi:hypothetical protein JYB64_05985 [Algoriphagus aestuarii]|nr:hypothetical protein [Algoriphagus aestuarii]